MPPKQEAKPKRKNTPNLTAAMPCVTCPHCHARHDPKALRVTHTFPNGNRRHHCADCGKPFVSIYRVTM